MKNKCSLITIGILLAIRAQAGMWGSWVAGGSACNASNVSVIDNGDTLSVLFDALSVNMPEGEIGDGTTARKTCTFRIQVTPPNGFYLAGFKQLYSGGVIKSAGSSAMLNIRYNLGPVAGVPLPIVFPAGREIAPEDAASQFQRTYNNNLLIANCGGRTNYGLNLTLTARRYSYADHIIAGLDSVDAKLKEKIILIPEYALCR